jgi:integrase
MENAMNFRQQAEQFMTTKGGSLRPNSLHVYRSLLDARILPAIGEVEMRSVDSATVKTLVSRLAEAHLSPATISLAVSLVKKIVKSAWDSRGNRLYRVDWNNEFIAAPRVEPTSQNAPIASAAAITAASSAISNEVRVLVALLAGTGLRIGEALALTVSDWDPAAGTLRVHSTMVHGQIQGETKTKAGTRVVDLDRGLNQLLYSLFANREQTGLLFLTGERTLRRRITELGLPGFHSLRRFRITHLQTQNVPPVLTKFWAGHAAGDTTERYTKMGAQIEERKAWSERAGLGFQL